MCTSLHIANPDPLSGNVNSKLLQEPISHCHTCSQIHPKIQYTTLPRRFQQCLCIVSGLFVLPFNDITVSLTASAVPQYAVPAVRSTLRRSTRREDPRSAEQARLCSTAFRAQSGSFVTLFIIF